MFNNPKRNFRSLKVTCQIRSCWNSIIWSKNSPIYDHTKLLGLDKSIEYTTNHIAHLLLTLNLNLPGRSNYRKNILSHMDLWQFHGVQFLNELWALIAATNNLDAFLHLTISLQWIKNIFPNYVKKQTQFEQLYFQYSAFKYHFQDICIKWRLISIEMWTQHLNNK